VRWVERVASSPYPQDHRAWYVRAAAELRALYGPHCPRFIGMADGARKTEHAGAKKGRGAYYGRKADANRVSNRRRRVEGKRLTKACVDRST